jgi:hypothetical protein
VRRLKHRVGQLTHLPDKGFFPFESVNANLACPPNSVLMIQLLDFVVAFGDHFAQTWLCTADSMSWVTTHDSIIDLRDLWSVQAFEKLHRPRKPRSENFSERRDIRCASAQHPK